MIINLKITLNLGYSVKDLNHTNNPINIYI